MKRFYFLIIALVFALCACTPGGDVEEVTGPGSEQTTPNNPGNDGGENGDKPGDGNGGESGEEGGKNEGEGGENGEGGNEGGSEGENEPLFEIVEPERTSAEAPVPSWMVLQELHSPLRAPPLLLPSPLCPPSFPSPFPPLSFHLSPQNPLSLLSL